MNLEGRICAITGAGRGIGQQIAFDFVRKGAKVYVCDIDQDRLAGVRQASEQAGRNIAFAVCDVSDERSVMGWFESIQGAENRLDVLVNNAGITRDGLLVRVKDGEVSRLPLVDFERVVAVAPGYTRTEMVAAVSPPVLEKIVAQVPLRRLGEATEISSAVRFIVENDFVTGRILEIDGGLRI